MEVMGTYAGDKSPPELEPLLLQRRSGDDGGENGGDGGGHYSPLALTQFAFRLGRAAWSLVCSMDSGGSW